MVRGLTFPRYCFTRVKAVEAVRNRHKSGEASRARLPECSNNLCRLREYSSQ